ncbi:MAG: dienelactone hydrolase family protein [Labilithrix sp.]|nr:dienelactone hydrolase family protein [Labilithrix sp.]
MERPLYLRLRIAVVSAIAASLAVASAAHAAPKKATTTKSKLRRAPKASGPLPWCAEEFETLPNGLCHIDGGQKEGRRTLVVFLHGAIAKDVDWQWLQERALARQAKQSKFEAIFARAPLGPSGFVWPGTASAQETSEEELIEGWAAARTFLEKRSGEPYDDVFLMGFSSGAYFVSSLALRGRGEFDGYATFAGGSAGWQSASNAVKKAPVYVGVCADDRQTASHSRAFGGALAARGWPNRVDEQKVGHMFSDVHVAHALTYLRSAHPPARLADAAADRRGGVTRASSAAR